MTRAMARIKRPASVLCRNPANPVLSLKFALWHGLCLRSRQQTNGRCFGESSETRNRIRQKIQKELCCEEVIPGNRIGCRGLTCVFGHGGSGGSRAPRPREFAPWRTWSPRRTWSSRWSWSPRSWTSRPLGSWSLARAVVLLCSQVRVSVLSGISLLLRLVLLSVEQPLFRWAELQHRDWVLVHSRIRGLFVAIEATGKAGAQRADRPRERSGSCSYLLRAPVLAAFSRRAPEGGEIPAA